MKNPLATGFGVLVFLIVTAFGATVWYVSNGIKTDPVEILEMTSQILPVNIPEGLKPEMGADILGAKIVVFEHEGEGVNHLSITKLPAKNISKARSNWDAKIEQDWDKVGLRATGEGVYHFTYKGVPQDALYQDGIDESGTQMRSILMNFVVDKMNIGVFRLGPAGQVTEANFQKMLDS